jgi:penicillin V acylase-like amidase (Ntn superfamily)
MTNLPIFSVQVTCSQTYGSEQQNTLDTLVSWSARLHPELGIKLVDAITAICQVTLPGAMNPISESAARALDSLGKDKQLILLEPPAETPEQE